MESEEPADIRLIYLAMHNIVKCRGNFLREDESGITARNANSASSVDKLVQTLSEYLDERGELGGFSADAEKLCRALDAKGMNKAQRMQLIEEGLGMQDGKRAKLIAKASVGNKAEFSNLFEGLEKSAIFLKKRFVAVRKSGSVPHSEVKVSG